MPRRSIWLASLALIFAMGAAGICGISVWLWWRPASTPTLDLPLKAGTVRRAGAQLVGRLDSGLPPFHLHWDGQPPHAWLMDTDTQTILATPVFSSETFEQNVNCVWWTEQECRFSVTALIPDERVQRVVLRCEVVPDRRCFYVASIAALGCTMLLLFGWQVSAFLSGNQHARWRLLCNGGKKWLFFGIAILNFTIHYPGDWASLPFVQGDAANIASFAAALEQPELFHYDKLLGNPHHFDWYTPGFLWIVRLTARAGFHYTTTFAFVGFVATWMALLGYDRLLTFLSGSRLFGLLASVGLWLLDRSYPLESWSFFNMLPRSLFSACLPYLFLAMIHVVGRPGRWWIPAVLAAFTFYIHPVSAPAWIGAVLCAFWTRREVPFVRRVVSLGCASGAVLVVMSPYAWTYVAKYRGTVNVDPAVAARSLEYARERFPEATLDYVKFWKTLARTGWQAPRFVAGGVLLLVLLPFRNRDGDLRFFFGALAGFGLVTFLLPGVDIALANHWRQLPFQVDLVRGVRYLDVILLILLALVARKQALLLQPCGHRFAFLPVRALLKRRALTCVVLLLVVFFYGNENLAVVGRAAQLARMNYRLLHNQPGPESVAIREVLGRLQAWRKPDEIVYGPLGLRQDGIPLTSLHKDLAALAYSDPAVMIEARERLDRAEGIGHGPLQERQVRELATTMECQWLILKKGQAAAGLAASPLISLINSQYVLIHVPR